MGSGTYLNNAIKKYGIENFKKEILEFRNTREEISELESEIVTLELLKDTNCYNIKLGGDEATTFGTATMKDSEGNIKQVPIGSNEYKNMVGSTTGLVAVFDKVEQINKQVAKEEYDLNRDRYRGCSFGKIVVIGDDGKCISISHEDYISGNYKTVWSGRKHTDETKRKMRETYQKTNHQQGIKNSQYGTCWVTKDGVTKKIKVSELSDMTSNGWKRGRKI